MDDAVKAKVMRAIWSVYHPEFEDVGQPISQMRFLAKHHEFPLEQMAEAAAASLKE